MSIELLRGCPDCGLFDGGSTQIECGEDINYSDNGCDDYDRIARMYICSGQCYETIYLGNADEPTCLEVEIFGIQNKGFAIKLFIMIYLRSQCLDNFTMTWESDRALVKLLDG